MRPLIITEDIRDQIKKIMTHAYNNIVTIPKTKEPKRLKEITTVGNNDKHCIFIPVGFKVVFSIEDWEDQLGLTRHLSTSINTPGKIPSFIEVDMLIEEFGFDNPLHKCLICGELFDNNQTAINVLECVKDWPDEKMRKDLYKENSDKLGKTIIDIINQRRGVINEHRRNTH